MDRTVIMWIIFLVVVIGMLVIDLKVFNKKAHEVKLKEAAIWSIVWVVISLLFGVGVYFELGKDLAMKFLTGYIVEKALSMDNLFVFLIIFSYFKIPAEDQHKALFWGILGALISRAIFIAAGVALIQSLYWTIYVLGAFLVFTGIKLAVQKDKEIHPEKNVIVRLFRKIMPVTTEYTAGRFFVRKAGRLFATPLFVAVVVLETTDVVFATDSIPAILGITLDPFIVYSSNIFAILGLRAMYFLLAGIMGMFRFLNVGLSLILVFVGAKMLAGDIVHLPVELELSIVAGILLGAILLSVLLPSKEKPA